MRSSASRLPTTTRNGTAVADRVRLPKLSHLVADRLRAQIGRGELTAGDSLPPERELLKQFGVSRPTLREAMRVLEAQGLIQLDRGARAGAVILAPSIESASGSSTLYLASHGTTLGEVHEVRTLLEPSLAALLARRTKKPFLQPLRQCVREQRAALEAKDFPRAVTALNEMHRVMVDFTENRALSMLAGMLQDIPGRLYSQYLLHGTPADQLVFRKRTEKSIDAHARLVELIGQGRADEAEAFWRTYMQDTAAYLAKTGLAAHRVQAHALAP